ncbi:MAG: twin-arginine translocase TatA/TatE family subunit [Hyphomicrobiales bacterium]|nr:twin-arginine translocase TatA/TatE family subunit [Hyphomicrobiales bacterium]
MGGLSLWQILIVALVVVLLFGRGKISDLMGDVAKGMKSFKKGLADDDEPQKIDDQPTMTVDVEASREKTKAT